MRRDSWKSVGFSAASKSQENDPFKVSSLFVFSNNNFQGLEKLKTETAVKHTYDYSAQKWRKTRIQIKMESEQFAEGCMRRAFKAKTLEGKKNHPEIKEEKTIFRARF